MKAVILIKVFNNKFETRNYQRGFPFIRFHQLVIILALPLDCSVSTQYQYDQKIFLGSHLYLCFCSWRCQDSYK